VREVPGVEINGFGAEINGFGAEISAFQAKSPFINKPA